MAMFTCNCPSYLLGHETRFNVYLPEYAEDNVKTLYLLHGMGDDCTTWFRRTSAERYIRSHTAALICPDGENSFYTDMAVGKPYYSYIINGFRRPAGCSICPNGRKILLSPEFLWAVTARLCLLCEIRIFLGLRQACRG